MKALIVGVLALVGSVSAFAGAGGGCTAGACPKPVVKVEAKKEDGGCCASKAAKVQVKAEGGECCKSKAAKVQVKAEGGECCKSKAAKVQVKAEGGECCKAKAGKVQVKMEGKEACCKSTAAKPMAKGGKGCCNETGALAKFKIFVDGQYMYYGCEGSANKARKEMMPVAFRVGAVQKVSGKVMIPKNQSLVALVK
jgi:hypothetical protein